MKSGIDLVYGGGSIGLMGFLSHAVHDGGRHVLGFILSLFFHFSFSLYASDFFYYGLMIDRSLGLVYGFHKFLLVCFLLGRVTTRSLLPSEVIFLAFN